MVEAAKLKIQAFLIQGWKMMETHFQVESVHLAVSADTTCYMGPQER